MPKQRRNEQRLVGGCSRDLSLCNGCGHVLARLPDGGSRRCVPARRPARHSTSAPQLEIRGGDEFVGTQRDHVPSVPLSPSRTLMASPCRTTLRNLGSAEIETFAASPRFFAATACAVRVWRCNISRSPPGFGLGGIRQRRRRDQGLPGGSSRSISPHARSARVTVEPLGDHGCPWQQDAG